MESTAEKVVVKSGDSSAHIYLKPFKLDIYYDNLLVISTNARGLLRFEYLRPKPIKLV